MMKPIVTIVGRPNVGKSTLFNRLAGVRLAITDELPGTTRDRLAADISWADREFTLVDTGGLEVRPVSDLSQKVKDQVEMAIQEAEVIIFLVDVKSGLVVPDMEIAHQLRRSGKPVVLAVNKCDNQERREQAAEFYQLALGEPIPLSAYHGTGIGDLMARVVAHLPPVREVPEEPGLKIAIVGRPNVGKSMLLNAILGEQRAIVDEAPGTTRDAIDTPLKYNGRWVLLIDTAGLRRRGRIAGIERYSALRAFRAIGRADVVVPVLDATELVTAQDAHVAGYAKEALKGIVLVVNKWDLAKNLGWDEESCQQLIRRRLPFLSFAPILFVSAKLGWGVEKVLQAAVEVWEVRKKQVPSNKLSRWLEQVLSQHPPSTAGRHLQIKKVVQTGVNPPTFTFWVDRPEWLHFSYQRYLENRLREDFGFKGTPLGLRLVATRRRKARSRC
ncbi:MAG: ribosome biogenesis GTPase Der [Chloroflexi bacterium]|nr:MAG: ribosome biogenesis GTPase Der [Chloroflexota bacterium]